jgi:linoleoyl-CoA desaturase
MLMKNTEIQYLDNAEQVTQKESLRKNNGKALNTMVMLKFSNENGTEFSRELRGRVKRYFEEKGLSKHANTNMVLKTIFMLAFFLAPYFLMITGIVTGVLPILLMWVMMGFGAAGIGLAIMHDANHKAYSANKTINRILAYLLNLIGGHVPTWEIQHNVRHHGYTNIDGYDDDIDAGTMLRFSPNENLKSMHKYQHIYAWPLYCLMTIKWITTKDFLQMFRYRKEGFLPGSKLGFIKKITFLTISKLLFYGYILVIPMLVLPIPWWMVLLFFFVMECITGFSLTIIFQTAHVMPTSQYPVPDDQNTIENNWLIHQMDTTTDYAPDSRIFSWLIGGLNYQIEHHLFPNICHVHYRRLSVIVRETAQDFKIQYNSQPNFRMAVISHARMLKRLGRA